MVYFSSINFLKAEVVPFESLSKWLSGLRSSSKMVVIEPVSEISSRMTSSDLRISVGGNSPLGDLVTSRLELLVVGL